MSEDLCGAKVDFTDDNIHLSKVIPRASQAPSAAVCNPLSVQPCTDPKILELIAAATAANTRRAYESDLEHFIGWGGALPATPQAVAAYTRVSKATSCG